MVIICVNINAQDSTKLALPAYYSGPIIDVHIHASNPKNDSNPALGKLLPPWRGITGVKRYKAPATSIEVREATFAKFKYPILN